MNHKLLSEHSGEGEFSRSHERQEREPLETRPLSDLLMEYVNGERGEHLRQYQKAALEDVSLFLANGGRRGYVEAPTGTGKTVEFVALATVASERAGQKVLVVTPKKDLVYQTVGSGGRGGFSAFAPDLEVGTYFSDTPNSEKHLESPVTVTTYQSLIRLVSEDSRESAASGISMNRLAMFDLVILDEAHRAMGNETQEALSVIPEDTPMIGFTATPNFSSKRGIDQILPHTIHKMELLDSIESGILSPLVPVSLASPSDVVYGPRVSNWGDDYTVESLSQMIFDKRRNAAIVDIAAMAIAEGNTPVVATIPGNDMLHPRLIASILNGKHIEKNGKDHIIRFAAITSQLSAVERRAIYDQLEAGELDGLSYIDVLGEGWDSQRANVLISARPTRSPLAARQRLGRILRKRSDERPAVVIDIVDKLTDGTAPAVTLADTVGVGHLDSQVAIGVVEPSGVQELFDGLSYYEIIDGVDDSYTQYEAMMAELPKVRDHELKSESLDGKVSVYRTLEGLAEHYAINDAFIDRFADTIEQKKAVSRHRPIMAYNNADVYNIVKELPLAGQKGCYVYFDGEKEYMALEDMQAVIENKIDGTDDERALVDANMTELLRGMGEYIMFAQRPTGFDYSRSLERRVVTYLPVEKARDMIRALVSAVSQ